MIKPYRAALAVLAAATLSSPVHAGDDAASPSSYGAFSIAWDKAPTYKSADGDHEVALTGRVYLEAGRVEDDDSAATGNDKQVRQGRVGLVGRYRPADIRYKIEADFAGNDPDLKDAYVEWDGIVTVRGGQFRTPNSLENQTSSRFTTFQERARFVEAFGLARQVGGNVGINLANFTANFGAFRGDVGTGKEQAGTTYAGRLTYGPSIGPVQLHLGGSVRYRKRDTGQPILRYRARAQSALSNRFVDTAAIGREDKFYGVEGAAVWGPVALQGEYSWAKVDLAPAAAGPSDPTFSGGYMELSWYMTGEQRQYSPSKGRFSRTKVKHPVTEGGPGAWQLAYRFDHLDLTDKTVFGGEQQTQILGFNWHVTERQRIMVNYSWSQIEEATNPVLLALNGIDGQNGVQALIFRAQIEW